MLKFMKFSIRLAISFMCLVLLSCNAYDQRIKEKVDERLRELGLLAPKDVSTNDVGVMPDSGLTARAVETDPVMDTINLLRTFDELMKDYTPELSEVEDNTDMLSCITSYSLASNKELKNVKGIIEKRKKDSLNRIRKENDNFFRDTFPVQLRIDYNWATRMTKPVFGCYLIKHSCWNMNVVKESCEYNRLDNCETWGAPLSAKRKITSNPPNPDNQWRLKIPSMNIYSHKTEPAEPALMKFISEKGIKIPEKYYCVVDNVVGDKPIYINCAIIKGISSAIRLDALSTEVNVGDVVSVPLANQKRDPDGVLARVLSVPERKGKQTWMADADSKTLKVEKKAECPTIQDILKAVE